MTLDLAALRLLAWQGPFNPCETCAQTVGHRCRTASGNLTTPHESRMKWAAGYDARQSEVNQLQQNIAERDVAISADQNALRIITVERDGLKVDVQSLTLESSGLTDQVGKLTADLTLTKAEFAAYVKAHPDAPNLPEPEPAKPRLLIGAGGGNSDRTKQAIDIDRRYYGGADTDITALVKAAKANATAAGILTWATFKLPVSWADAVAGKADAWFDKLTAACRGLGFEIWIDLHHEPEGDGDGNLWRQIQSRFALRLGDGATGPVKFLLCVTGYSEEYGTAAATKWDTYWPADAKSAIYAIAYDNPYLRYGVPLGGGTLDKTWSEGADSYIKKLAARARSLGVKAAIGEFGFSDEAFAKDPAWIDRTLAAMATESDVMVGACYFDSILNSTRSWPLGPAGSPKRVRFEQAAAALR